MSVVVRHLGVVGDSVDVGDLTVEFVDDIHDVAFDFGQDPIAAIFGGCSVP